MKFHASRLLTKQVASRGSIQQQLLNFFGATHSKARLCPEIPENSPRHGIITPDHDTDLDRFQGDIQAAAQVQLGLLSSMHMIKIASYSIHTSHYIH